MTGKADKAGRTGWLLLLLLLLVACSEESPAARTRVFDSAGITIVENSDAAEPAIASRLVESHPILRIGQEDGPEAYRFDGVRDIARLSDSTIVVADRSGSIRFFDKRGQFLRAVGRHGEGPGEYRVINFMRRIRSDSLLVWDFPARRITILAPDGTLQRSEPGPVTEGFFYGLDAFAEGSLLGSYDGPLTGARPANGILRTTSAVVRFSPSSGTMDTLALITIGSSYVSGGEHFRISSMPYPAEAMAIAAGRSAYVGSSERFEIAFRNENGQLVRLIRLDRAPAAIDDSTRERYIADQLLHARTEAGRERLKALYAELPFPKTLPAFGALAVDADSNLWVSAYALTDTLPTRWTIFDPAGRILAEARTPARFKVFAIAREDIIGVRSDSVGTEQVQVLRLRKVQ